MTRLIVCVKQVPDTSEVEMDKKTGTIIREGVPSILNPFCEFALHEALRLKDKMGGTVCAITMGPPQAEDALKKCLAIGADEAILLTDPAFAGSDTYATAYTLAQAIKRMGEFDLVFCGQQAIDGDTAQVGPELARLLDIPQLTYIESIEQIEAGGALCKQETDSGYQRVRSRIPALIACLPTPDFEPRIPNVRDVMKAKRKTISTWNKEDIGGAAAVFGLVGSPTQVIKVYSPPKREQGILIQVSPGEAAAKIVDILKGRGVIG